MPLTPKGEKIKSAMQDQYGDKKGESVFYASANKGKITGVHESRLPCSGVTKQQMESFETKLHKLVRGDSAAGT